ncbi:hypothetical protein EDC01DRAFT_432200 [Geopyxis carbonaria]|nr:hypothetical protein EDC01DRAFT_432200 [Geopyxis carbonaria]
MAAKATLDSIMRQASDNYLNLIPNDSHRPKLKAEIQSATVEDLLKQVHDLEDKFSKNSRFRRLSKRLSPCVEQLQRFTAVVTICIQSDPQLSSLIWGGLKFLLQLASEFQEFFEKLIRTIEQMTKVIPDYQIYLDRFSTDDSLCQHLVSIYVDIIGFWRQATQIFLKPSQDPRSNVSVICSIAWRPFDSRFKEIVTRFSENCTYLERRVKALSCREEMIQAREAAEQAKTEDEARKQQSIAAQKEKLAVNYERIAANHERTESSLFRERYSEFESELRGTIKAQIQNDKDHRFLEIRTWLNPASCVDKKAEISNDRHPGSGEFVLRSSQYRQWLDRGISEPKNEPFKRGLLWINGKPGSGKTYLSALLIEDLLSISAQNTAYFYCDWKDSDRSTTRGLLSTLLFQFLANNKELPQLIDAFILAMMDSASAVANSVEELWQLLSIILKLCPGSIIVVDGLDELEDNYNGIVAAQRFSTLSLLNQSARILILGRDSSLPLEKNLSKHICLSLHTDAIQDDICKYIASRAGELVSLGFSNTTATRILHHLSSLATGMFLWARLALDVLSSPALSPSQRTEVFETIILVEGLEDFYSRIVERILRQPRPERELSSKIIMWILNGRRFQMEELNVAIAQGNQPLKTHETVKSLQDIAHIACGGLVRIDGKCIEFIHLSFHEYLRKRVSQSRSATTIHGELPMFQPMHIQQAMVATTCLNYLLQTVPARPLAGDIHKKSSYGELYSKYPFLMYASRFWVRHAKEAMINGTTTLAEPVTLELVSKMEILFASREHQLVWIEAMLPYGLEILMLEFVSIRAWLLSFPQYESLSARIGAFERDARMFYLNFVFDFQNREERDVWTGMSDFLSPDSPLNQNPANATECKPSPPFLTDNETLTMIRMTSETSADGTTLFLATVWACS